MTCRMCGAEIPDWFVICGICGTPVTPLFRRRKKNTNNTEAPDGSGTSDTSGISGISGASGSEADTGKGIPRLLPRFRKSRSSQPDLPSVLSSEAYSGAQTGTSSIWNALLHPALGNISLRLALISILLLPLPQLAVAVALVAAALGTLSLVRGEPASRHGIAGITIGTIVLLTGSVLLFCMAALGPYREELLQILQEHFYQK